MESNFKRIQAMYEDGYERHGDSPAALLTPKGRHELRFRSIDSFLSGNQNLSVLDYGCGLGYLNDYISARFSNISYSGMDIVPAFIEACKNKFTPNNNFFLIDPTLPVKASYDIVFASGVFNIQMKNSKEQSKAYSLSKLKELFTAAEQVLICDFLSPFVDFQEEDALHFTVDEITRFCAENLSRRFVIRHDLLPYEFTLVVYKNASIERPGNYYQEDKLLLEGEGKL